MGCLSINTRIGWLHNPGSFSDGIYTADGNIHSAFTRVQSWMNTYARALVVNLNLALMRVHSWISPYARALVGRKQ